jgi:hypothetical protein
LKISIIFILILVASSSSFAKNVEVFEYPTKISCVPEMQIGLNINDGIHKVDTPVTHVFEFVANGKYRFPKRKGSDYVIVFDSDISHDGSVINIYSDSVFYSIAMYAERYVASASLSRSDFPTVHTTLYQGKCEIDWK